ncbi:MAG: restriction endonuclease subunit S [Bacteroidales bacterium]|nr:restriction endonuclease subunit S [Bacteroidales bacterium]
MERYEKYKDSGIEWIGEIPEHWSIAKLKYYLCIQSGTGININDIQDDGAYYVYGGNGVMGKTNKFNSSGEVLIIGRVGALCGNVHIINNDIWISDNALWGQSDQNQLFLYYYLKYFDLNRLANKNAQPLITGTMVKEQFVGFPPLPEQTAIANFLDRKTTEIDDLIAKKKRLLELYEEEKTALINRAVTKGINPDAPMKDSGIEWLGEIPAHWEVKKLSWCFGIIGSGTTPKAGEDKYYENGCVNWLLTGDLNDSEIHETTKKVTQDAINKYTSLKIYPPDSLVIAMYGATIGKLGILKIPSTVNQACCVMAKPESLLYKFAFYYLKAAKKEIINLSYGGGQPNINQELIRAIKIPFPNIIEQKEIVSYIENELNQLSIKKNNSRKLIDLLIEYRTALISEVVTGKVKVT